MIEPEPIQQLDDTHVRWRNRKLLYFSGCDYFRLSRHPVVVKAAQDGLRRSGLSVAASRMTTGNHNLYIELEAALAKFFGAEAAILAPAGYLTNIAVAQSVAGHFSHALLDERVHPALLDAANFLECPLIKFGHRDVDSFVRALGRCGAGARPIVLTDGMFSHDGSVAPLSAYLKVLPGDALLLVDDAHGAGVLGATGKGSLEHEHVPRNQIIQCVSLSKAFGAHGGAVLTTKAMRKRILERSRILTGSTPMALPVVSAALASLRILTVDRARRNRLFKNVARVRQGLHRAGVEVCEHPGPIVALADAPKSRIAGMKARLLGADILPPFLKYPGGAEGGYFRFVISSEHSIRELDHLVATICP